MMYRDTVCLYAILLLGLIVGALPLRALSPEGERGVTFDTKGFVDTYHAMRVTSPHDIMSSRTRLRGEFTKRFDESVVVASFDAAYNPITGGPCNLKLREAYFEHQEEFWKISFGRQFVIWGTADGVRITDLVSPMDLTEFLAQDYDDIRLPVNALRFSLYNEKLRFETILVPTFEGYILPTGENNPWSIFSSSGQKKSYEIEWDDKDSKPALKLANIEYGGRLSFTLPGVDFSLAALHTWNKMPVLQIERGMTPGSVRVSPRYYRMGFVGGDIAKPLCAFVLRGEAAFNIDKHFRSPEQGFNSLNWLVGADWYAPYEWMLSAQLSSESIFDYDPIAGQDEHTSLLTLHISKKMLGSTLSLANFTYLDLNNGAWFSRFSGDYALSDQLHLLAGYDWFAGQDNGSLFARYRDNSEVWIKARYSF